MLILQALALAGLSASLAFAQNDVTVTNTDPSITYEGENIGDASICQKDSNGNFITAQPGCYNFAEPCTESVKIGRGRSSAASFTFKGSAVYINSALNRISPLYTVTLDGQAEDVDGFRESMPLTCQRLFSRRGLDPTIDHTITLSIKGPSPQGNLTEDSRDLDFVFSLINFTYASGSPSAAVALFAPVHVTLGAALALSQVLL